METESNENHLEMVRMPEVGDMFGPLLLAPCADQDQDRHGPALRRDLGRTVARKHEAAVEED